MAPERLEDFFEKWTEAEFPVEGENCLPDFQLVEIAKSKGDETWSPRVAAHLRECDHCSEVVKLLRSTEQAPGRIYELLGRRHEKERTAGRAPRPSVFSQAWSFFSFGQPRWAVPALAVSLILLFVGWAVSSKLISPNENGAVVASLDEDVYGNTTQLLKASVAKLNDPSVDLSEKRLQLMSIGDKVKEINTRLDILTKQDLTPARRAELANLVAAYNSRATIVQHALAAQKSAPPAPVSQITPTADSDLVVRIYTTAYSSTSKKNASGEDKEVTDAEAAEAVQAGKDEINVVAIKEGEVEVQDLKPRSPEDTNALRQSLLKTLSGSANQQPLDLKLTSASSPARVQ